MSDKSTQYEGDKERLHTPEHPFCSRLSCICHQDEQKLQELVRQLDEGLITVKEARHLWRGGQEV